MIARSPTTAHPAARIADDPLEPWRGAPGAVVLISDVACPWATVITVRLRAARARCGLVDRVSVIHLAHPLELVHERVLARRVIDAEIPLCAAAAPDFGWSLWQGRLDEYPASSLLAVEAVQAARRQSEVAAEELDLALRSALFVESRCITARHEVLRAAACCPALDAGQLARDLDTGVARGAVMRQSAVARAMVGACTGYVIAPDGSGGCNPGITTAWIGADLPRGVPVLTHDAPEAYDGLVAAAAASSPEPNLA